MRVAPDRRRRPPRVRRGQGRAHGRGAGADAGGRDPDRGRPRATGHGPGRPRLSGLGLDKLGIELKPGTAIPVDVGCRVGPPGQQRPAVWAAGDVTGRTDTHTAKYRGGVVAANILGQRREADYRAIPRAVYTIPAAFAVGASPQGAAEAGISLLTAGANLQDTARATVAGEDAGRVELYAHPEFGAAAGGGRGRAERAGLDERGDPGHPGRAPAGHPGRYGARLPHLERGTRACHRRAGQQGLLTAAHPAQRAQTWRAAR